jgi:mannose/fructose/N-acetylgalactosamine-specific phosphotransferase system component IIB
VNALNIGNLYKLKGSTQINEAVVISEEENETTHL